MVDHTRQHARHHHSPPLATRPLATGLHHAGQQHRDSLHDRGRQPPRQPGPRNGCARAGRTRPGPCPLERRRMSPRRARRLSHVETPSVAASGPPDADVAPVGRSHAQRVTQIRRVRQSDGTSSRARNRAQRMPRRWREAFLPNITRSMFRAGRVADYTIVTSPGTFSGATRAATICRHASSAKRSRCSLRATLFCGVLIACHQPRAEAAGQPVDHGCGTSGGSRFW